MLNNATENFSIESSDLRLSKAVRNIILKCEEESKKCFSGAGIRCDIGFDIYTNVILLIFEELTNNGINIKKLKELEA